MKHHATLHAILSIIVTKTNLKTCLSSLWLLHARHHLVIRTKWRYDVTAGSLKCNHPNLKFPRVVIDIISRQFPKALFIFNQILSRRLNNIFLRNMKIMEINSYLAARECALTVVQWWNDREIRRNFPQSWYNSINYKKALPNLKQFPRRTCFGVSDIKIWQMFRCSASGRVSTHSKAFTWPNNNFN